MRIPYSIIISCLLTYVLHVQGIAIQNDAPGLTAPTNMASNSTTLSAIEARWHHGSIYWVYFRAPLLPCWDNIYFGHELFVCATSDIIFPAAAAKHLLTDPYPSKAWSCNNEDFRLRIWDPADSGSSSSSGGEGQGNNWLSYVEITDVLSVLMESTEAAGHRFCSGPFEIWTHDHERAVEKVAVGDWLAGNVYVVGGTVHGIGRGNGSMIETA